MCFNIYGVPSQLVVRWLLNYRKQIDTWVDLGCGNGEYLRLINFIPKEGIGIDAVPPEQLPPNFRFQKSEINEWLDERKNEKLDLVTMFDLVEHFPKAEALVLIEKAENLAKNLIIATPHGFMKQDGESDARLKNNPWQWHRCGFGPAEFEKMGFLVFVLKNYHYRPAGNDQSFDKLICFKSRDVVNFHRLAARIRLKNLLYNLHPLYFYRTLRQLKG